MLAAESMKNYLRLLMRSVTAVTAWIIAWVVYMIAMMMTVYDGLLSLIFQPIMAALTSTLFVGAALLVGLVFRIPFIGRVWSSSWCWAGLLAVSSLFVLCLGSTFGMTSMYTNPETGTQFRGIHPVAALGGYFVLIFSIANWPLPVKRKGVAQN